MRSRSIPQSYRRVKSGVHLTDLHFMVSFGTATWVFLAATGAIGIMAILNAWANAAKVGLRVVELKKRVESLRAIYSDAPTIESGADFELLD